MTLVDVAGRAGIKCPECAAESSHPEDVKRGYCGRCHWFTSCPDLWLPWAAARRARELGPRLPVPPERCHNSTCSALDILDTEAPDVDPADATRFWWCPGCQWSGLAIEERRYTVIHDPGDGVRAERWVRPGRERPRVRRPLGPVGRE